MPTRRRARYARNPYDHGRPIAQPNLSPAAIFFAVFALVFLALLRPPTHALLINIPVTSGLGEAPEQWPADIPVHRLVLSPANEMLWDGEPVSHAELIDRLHAASTATPRPGIVFAPRALTSYDLSAQVLNILAIAGVTEERFCLGGLAQHREFAKDPAPYRLSLSITWPEDLMDPLPSEAVPECDLFNPVPRSGLPPRH